MGLFTRLERGEQRLELAQPMSTAHEYSAIGARGATAQLEGTRFQNRFRQGGVSGVLYTSRFSQY